MKNSELWFGIGFMLMSWLVKPADVVLARRDMPTILWWFTACFGMWLLGRASKTTP